MVGALARRNPLVVAAATGLAAGLAARLLASHEISDVILFATLVGCGGPLVYHTVLGLARGRYAADIIATLAIVAAVFLHQYFAGVIIVLMQSGGEALERYAMGRASESLDALLARAPKIAHRIAGERTIEDVWVDAVQVGDSLVIRPGELVPVDGTVIEGHSTVDQSMVTGEPFPVPARAGLALLSGTLNLEGALTFRAERPSSQSQYQQILDLVRAARAQKPPIQRLADRWAIWFTPATLLVCIATYVFTRNPTAVLAVLVVATPCPLILAVPVSVIAAISRAAERGVIVKSGAAIEQLGLARAVVFDKTGTLTLGHPTVAGVHAADELPEREVLRLAAAVEQLSSHHLGQAIAEEGRRRLHELPRPVMFRETAGSGVTGAIDGHQIIVGSASFLTSQGLPVNGSEPERPTAYVGVDGRLAGTIEFADRLRHQVPSLMQRLAILGVRETVMLTGDRRSSAETIAAQAGILSVLSELLPADKVAAVSQLKQSFGTVVMVGDGINDAPALAAATVGIALGAHGPAAAAQAADVVLLVDDISRVADAVEISRRMRRIALQSIGFGLGVSLVLMVIASFGMITPAAGAVMQEALDVAVILNALRVK
ncbi:MAG: cadmium-translocating P-type ATPase [Gemmatimonadetes bacterium]|nr:cadmium-translocating P-type ATPase [Gemmatimonadota bacterium]